jgi:pimeloyl-ACP methyl ester carboxylesterase
MKLVFIHGLVGGTANFRDLIQELDDFECVTFDLIGFGNEKKPKIEYNVSDFVSFIRQRIPTGKIVLVGHSMGTIICKEYMKKYPKDVVKTIFINYPLRKDCVKNNWFCGKVMNESIVGKLLCNTKIIWKYFFYPFAMFSRNFDSFRAYFKHTYWSESKSLKNTVMKDVFGKVDKKKSVFIMGEFDKFSDEKMMKGYEVHRIKKMGHLFFGFENEVAGIILKSLSSKSNK